MGKYTIRVVTGDSLLAGSCNQVQLWLVGEHWEADLGKKLRPVRRGTEFKVGVPLHLGRLLLVKLRKDEHLGDFDWFCKWISVRRPGTNGEALFPCYSWVQGSGIVCLPEGTEDVPVSPSKPLIPHQIPRNPPSHSSPIPCSPSRWGSWKDGLILPVVGRTPWDLPKNERFREDKDFDFSFSLAKAYVPGWVGTCTPACKVGSFLDLLALPFFPQVGGLGPQGTLELTNPVKRLEDFKRIFPSAKTALAEKVRNSWKDDALFGYQFLSGANPMLLRCSSSLPARLVLPPGMEDLKTQLEKELQVPLVMLKLQPDGKLLPMVIQLQPPHHGCPTPMLPSNPPMAWLLAKTWVRSSDFQMHQLQSHLLRGHLMAEVISVATMRTLPSLHPIYKLLIPHFRHTMEINIPARSNLVSRWGIFDLRATACLTYHSLCPLADLADHGLLDLKASLYGQDALRLWGIISWYVEGMVSLFYMTDEAVRDDPELQAWSREITETGLQVAASLLVTQVPCLLRHPVQLCHFVTMCIFTCPGQHASVHLGQLDWYSWIPNGPCTMWKPPPVSKDVTEKDIVDSLPTAHEAHMQKTFTKFLSRFQPIMGWYSWPRGPGLSCFVLPFSGALGQHKERYFSGPRPQAVAAVDQEIEARNAGLQLPYEYLRPSMVENSVTI
ncbi:unnamed protein product [Nyctereutes procyonoides]|uniref:(raccoon dog) hypothetical protein n=1 Tax=Nyctereutes procyonoides TaxID=34880 RepID=A0A811ZMC7_NYCPR|nr:unnamed protein product [Nyctereutes procyonoides]